MPFFPSDSDTPVAQLTAAGRNLLARSIVPRGKLNGTDPDLPLVTFKLAGFAVGDGGYDLGNPLIITPIVDATSQAIATVSILDNRFDVNDAIIINGVSFPVGLTVVASGTAIGGTDSGGPNSFGTVELNPGTLAPSAHIGQRLKLTGGTLGGLTELIFSNTDSQIEIDKTWVAAGATFPTVPDNTTTWQIITNAPGSNTWTPGADEEGSAQNLANAINASSHPLIKNVVRASVSGAIITIEAIALGANGNLNTLVEFDGGGFSLDNFGVLPGLGSLDGGTDPSLENQKFPPSFPDVENFVDIEMPNLSATSLVCRIGATDANHGLGEIGIYVDIIDSVNPAEIGSRILYAISHFPIVAKNANSVFVTRVLTQY